MFSLKRVMPVLSTALLLLFLLPAARATDIVELKTGERVEGKFKQATLAGVVIEVGGQTLTFEFNKVRAIYFESPPPISGSAGGTSLSEATKALKSLASVTTNSGITYNDYAPRVTDAKISVDRYLQENNQKETPIPRLMKEAMDLYVFTSSAWNSRITKRSWEVGNNPAVALCPAMTKLFEPHAPRGDNPTQIELDRIMFSKGANDDLTRGIIITENIPILMQCARDKTAEVEKAIIK